MRFPNMGKWLSLVMIPVVLGLSGCEDNNIWGKLRGNGGDAATLASLAETALQQGDYSRALELAQRALGQNPNDSSAAYTAAVANAAIAGFNIGTLVSNIVGSQNLDGLDGTIQRARINVGAQGTCGGANSIMRNLDCDRISARLNYSICLEQRIASGVMQGSIQPNQSGFLITYAFHKILRSTVRAIMAGFIDIVKVGTSYDAEVDASAANVCNTDPDLAILVMRDLTGVYAILNRVVNILGLSSNALVSEIRADILEVGDELFQELPAACTTLFSGIGITQGTFTTQTDAFDPPSSPC